MDFIISLFGTALGKVWLTFSHNWWLLLLSAVVATAMKLYVDQQKLAAFMQKHRGYGVVGATAVAVTTPLCSCGTMAIILGMMAGAVSWAPIVAFMVASPLTSPEELFYSAGLFGWPFAWTFFIASIFLGLLGGFIAYVAENRGWLKGQHRFPPVTASAGAQAADQAGPAVMAGAEPSGGGTLQEKARLFGLEFFQVGRRLLLYFAVFAFVGYVLNGLIPERWVTALFGNGHIYGVPLAATLGLPLYINTEASLPLVRSMMDLGMNPGAVLAFLITGAGTSIGAITGALTIARWRVVGIVVGTLWVGAVIFGYAYSALIGLGIV